jgi:hypothetical protein
MNKQVYLNQLQVAIEKLHECRATYRRTVPVQEVFKGKTLWKGEVEVFWLTGHPRAKRCYAWSQGQREHDGEQQFVAILEIPPVIGPATAVKSALAGHETRHQKEASG